MRRLLWEPTRLGDVEIRNRIVMPAFGLKYCGVDRKPTQRLADFYEERARGGCGLIVVGGIGIDMLGSGLMVPGIDTDELVPEWSNVSEAIHRNGAKVFFQLFHAGRYQHSALIRGEQAVAPSAVESRYTRETPRALEVEEILDIEKSFASAARRSREAGADGVELIASAGYLICQFLSPVTNRRDDEYGGSLENRLRFAREVISAVRSAVGDDYPVGMRVSGSEFMPGGNTLSEMTEICKALAAAGVGYFSVTGGWHETLVPQLPSTVPRGAYTYLAHGIRSAVAVPVIAANRIVEPSQAEAILADGLADMVAVGRAQIADPEWANKARDGRSSEIRPCVGCLQGCLDRLFSMREVECLCNPQAGHEGERRIIPDVWQLRVAVVGAGPAGLEAARTAALRGHIVAVFEKGPTPGGQLPLVAAAPGRGEFLRLLEFYLNEVRRLEIDLRLGVNDTLAEVVRWKPDRVILATGSRPIRPPIPGADRADVLQAWDVLLRRVDVGRTVAVIGGGAVGVETAIALADRGTVDGETLKFLLKHSAESADALRCLATRGTRKVTILEKTHKLGADIGPTTRWVFLKELGLLGVETITDAEVVSIEPGCVVYSKDGAERTLGGDSVVLALGSVSSNELEPAFRTTGLPYTVVGDAKRPRKLMDAVQEGFLAALRLKAN